MGARLYPSHVHSASPFLDGIPNVMPRRCLPTPLIAVTTFTPQVSMGVKVYTGVKPCSNTALVVGGHVPTGGDSLPPNDSASLVRCASDLMRSASPATADTLDWGKSFNLRRQLPQPPTALVDMVFTFAKKGLAQLAMHPVKNHTSVRGCASACHCRSLAAADA